MTTDTPTRDEAFQAVLDAMREYAEASRITEEHFLQLRTLRNAAMKSGEKLQAARAVLDRILQTEAGLSDAP